MITKFLGTGGVPYGIGTGPPPLLLRFIEASFSSGSDTGVLDCFHSVMTFI